MSKPKPDTNGTDEAYKAASQLIGSCLLTFGVLEHDSLEWIAALSTDKVIKDIAVDMPFRKRISLIRKLIRRATWPELNKDSATRLWGEVDKKVELRNTLAHNPLIMCPNADGKQQVYVLRHKPANAIGPVKGGLLSLRDVTATTDRLLEVIGKLRQIRLN